MYQSLLLLGHLVHLLKVCLQFVLRHEVEELLAMTLWISAA